MSRASLVFLVSAWALLLPLIPPSVSAQDPAPSASPAGPYATKAQRRALSEKLGAMTDAEFGDYIAAHREILIDPIVSNMLGYASLLGSKNDQPGEARVTRRAEQMAEASGSRAIQARVLWSKAGVEGTEHRLDQGIASLDRAIAMATEAKSPVDQLAGMMSQRIIYLVRKGDYARAMAECDRTLRLSTEAKYQDGAMATLSALANIYQRQGQPAQAIPYLEQARVWAVDDKRFQVFVDTNYGDVYRLLDQPQKAKEFLSRALATARQLDDQSLLLQTLNECAHAELEARDYAAARLLLQEASTLLDKVGGAENKVETQVQMASLEDEVGHHEQAAALARAAYDGAMAVDTREFAWQAQDVLGNALAADGKTEAALAAFRTAVDIIEEIRAGAAGDEQSSQSVLEKRIEPYQKLTALLAASGRAEEAFVRAENAKARVLRDILQNGRMDLSAVLTDGERKRQADSEETLAALNRKLQEARGARAASEIEKAEASLDAARVDSRNLRNTLLSAHPEARKREAATGVSTNSPATLATLCGTDTLFLEYVCGPESTTLFVAGPGPLPLEAHTLPLGAETLRRQVDAFRQGLAERSMNWKEGAGALGRALLAAVGPERLAKSAHLIIVPDGPLWDLPFQVLRPNEGGESLIDRVAVSYAPSASFLEQVRREGIKPGPEPPAKPAATRLLAMGNPSLGGDDPKNPAATLMGDAFAPLPAAEDEVRELARMYGNPQSDTFVGGAAREEVFKREAPHFDILHLATHGLLNNENPLYSCLLMAQTDLAPGEDGLLEAREIMALHLRARLAILAACETARGKAGAGEGQLGLSWALLVAGCPASVVSQWKVDSRSNVDLMLELHRQLRAGKPPDEALRQSALALRKMPGYDKPFYWAPFIVVGDGE